MEKKKLELYIHIPFCVRKCNYCDFLSAPASEPVLTAYTNALCREIESYTCLQKIYDVSTIFFGGGTPSIMKGTDIIRIMDTIKKAFALSEAFSYVEVSMECNPGTVTDEKLRAYKKCGVNRLSIGLQTANEKELGILGRIHTFSDFLESFSMARKAGFTNINVDLMTAIPEQTMESCLDTLEKVIALSPEHISAYSLILEEGTELFEQYQKKEKAGWMLPSEEAERQMYERTGCLLQEAGYKRYEISNYAREGYECRHNTGYWKRVDYLGLGLGASSLLSNTRFQNEENLTVYLEEWENNNALLQENVQVLTKQEQMEEFMFLGLRLVKGIRIAEFREVFCESYESVYGELTKQLIHRGLLVMEQGRVFLTAYGRDISNQVLAEFLF